MNSRNSFLVLIVSLLLAITTTSCGVSFNATKNVNNVQTDVVLAQKNFKVIGYVEGESQQNYWLGFGGLSKKSMQQAAMSDMFRNADLKGKSRAVVNVNVAYKYKSILIYEQVKCIATGTLIEFTD